jgi:anti-sigma B factor antagonist
MSADTNPLCHAARDGTTVRFPAGRALSEAHVEALTRRLPALIAARGHLPVTLDLGGVPGLPSGTLGKLLGLNRAVRAAEGRLVLVNPTPAVRRVLRLTRLDTVLDVRADEPLRV